MNFVLSLHPDLVKLFLRLTAFFPEKHIQVMCKGYDDDWELYTGLYWEEDKNLEKEWYEDYQLWVRF